MKEAYFTSDTIDEAVAALTAGLSVGPRGPAFDMTRAALLILDMQWYFLDQGSHAFIPSAPAIVPVIERLARAFREAGRPVIATQHVNTPGDAGMMGEWWGYLIVPDTPQAELDPRIETLATEIITKTRYDAFYNSNLQEILEKSDVGQLVIAGVMTHLCVETTARAAFVRDFAVFVPADATATYNREFHRATVLNLAHGIATITSAETVRV